MKLDNIKMGVYEYIENEIINKAQGVQKFIMCTIVSLSKDKLDGIMTLYMDKIKKLGVISDTGEIDINMIHNAMKQGIAKSGSFEWNNMIFDDKDVEKLFYYIGKRGQ